MLIGHEILTGHRLTMIGGTTITVVVVRNAGIINIAMTDTMTIMDRTEDTMIININRIIIKEIIRMTETKVTTIVGIEITVMIEIGVSNVIDLTAERDTKIVAGKIAMTGTITETGMIKEIIISMTEMTTVMARITIEMITDITLSAHGHTVMIEIHVTITKVNHVDVRHSESFSQ